MSIDLLRDDMARRLDLCSPDELRVLARLLERIELGRQRYGKLDLSQPRPRPWRLEFSEELLDAVVYDTFEIIRAEDIANADEQAEVECWGRVNRGTPAPVGDAVPVAIEPGEGPTDRSSR